MTAEIQRQVNLLLHKKELFPLSLSIFLRWKIYRHQQALKGIKPVLSLLNLEQRASKSQRFAQWVLPFHKNLQRLHNDGLFYLRKFVIEPDHAECLSIQVRLSP